MDAARAEQLRLREDIALAGDSSSRGYRLGGRSTSWRGEPRANEVRAFPRWDIPGWLPQHSGREALEEKRRADQEEHWFWIHGGVAERSKAAVLKTAGGASRPGVRIPSPPLICRTFRRRRSTSAGARCRAVAATFEEVDVVLGGGEVPVPRHPLDDVDRTPRRSQPARRVRSRTRSNAFSTPYCLQVMATGTWASPSRAPALGERGAPAPQPCPRRPQGRGPHRGPWHAVRTFDARRAPIASCATLLLVHSVPRLVRLAILDSYGVEWSLPTFARDVLQNFFDAALSFRESSQSSGTTPRPPSRSEARPSSTSSCSPTSAPPPSSTARPPAASARASRICALVGVRDHGLRDPRRLRRDRARGRVRARAARPRALLPRARCPRAQGFLRSPRGLHRGRLRRLRNGPPPVLSRGQSPPRPARRGGRGPHRRRPPRRPRREARRDLLSPPIPRRDRLLAERDIPVHALDLRVSPRRRLPRRRSRPACPRPLQRRPRRRRTPPARGAPRGDPPAQAQWRDGHDVLFGLLHAATERKLRFEWPDKAGSRDRRRAATMVSPAWPSGTASRWPARSSPRSA